MNVETGLKLIEEYVFELTGKKITANAPRNVVQQTYFERMVDIALKYFQNKQTN